MLFMLRCSLCYNFLRSRNELIVKPYILSFQENSALMNSVTNNLDTIPMSIANGSAVPVTSNASCTHAKLKQG